MSVTAGSRATFCGIRFQVTFLLDPFPWLVIIGWRKRPDTPRRRSSRSAHGGFKKSQVTEVLLALVRAGCAGHWRERQLQAHTPPPAACSLLPLALNSLRRNSEGVFRSPFVVHFFRGHMMGLQVFHRVAIGSSHPETPSRRSMVCFCCMRLGWRWPNGPKATAREYNKIAWVAGVGPRQAGRQAGPAAVSRSALFTKMKMKIERRQACIRS